MSLNIVEKSIVIIDGDPKLLSVAGYFIISRPSHMTRNGASTGARVMNVFLRILHNHFCSTRAVRRAACVKLLTRNAL